MHIDEVQAAVLAMTVNRRVRGRDPARRHRIGAARAGAGGARARAARAAGVRSRQLPQALANVYPALLGQVLIVMLGSAVVSQISVPDLTYAANFIQSRTSCVRDLHRRDRDSAAVDRAAHAAQSDRPAVALGPHAGGGGRAPAAFARLAWRARSPETRLSTGVHDDRIHLPGHRVEPAARALDLAAVADHVRRRQRRRDSLLAMRVSASARCVVS